ncbi:hypothetical protein TARUN_7650 [Trichoderma arundinaceum]|uniref:Uncharacterized protein n=1 Tax=Trichoderma arundinaceum TaxID=490622 RepID=A0A395NF74_TRIAR|nr:hypothetical protein TARUN_7650 [Trichoderma arundinaceum]
MVGAAQYQDDEIGWVLSAVVGKKKQSYIQIHFKEKFGRSLNHNQIRYIKNKYGKDPRFNADDLSENGDEDQSNEIGVGGSDGAGPSTQVGERQDGLTAAQSKRKRSVDDPGDVLESFQGPFHAGVYESTSQPQPLQLHNTGTGIGWTPSVTLGSHSWGSGNSPVFSSVGGGASPLALIQPSPVMEQHHTAEQTHALLQTPVTTQYQLQLPSSRLAALSVSQFSPSLPNTAPSPFPYPQERQHPQLLQQEQLHAPNTPILPNVVVSQVERHPSLDHISRLTYQLVPSFQEMPIESVSCDGTTQYSAFAGGGVYFGDYGGWDQMTADSPHEFSLSSSIPLPLDFPFQNVRFTGLTAASSQAIHQSLLNHPAIHDSNFVTQQQSHLTTQPNREHLDFGATTLELLNIIHGPSFNNNNNNAAVSHSHPPYPVYTSTSALSPLVTQAQSQPQVYQSRATPRFQAHDPYVSVGDIVGTIDPRLLIDNHTSHSASPHSHPSSPTLNTAKHEMEPRPVG